MGNDGYWNITINLRKKLLGMTSNLHSSLCANMFCGENKRIQKLRPTFLIDSVTYIILLPEYLWHTLPKIWKFKINYTFYPSPGPAI